MNPADTNKDGKLSVDEAKAAMNMEEEKAFAAHVTPEQERSVLESFKAGTPGMTLDEFKGALGLNAVPALLEMASALGLNAFSQDQIAEAFNEADINSDGTVNAADLGILLGAWGACP